MPIYKYLARKKTGEIEKGNVEAANVNAASEVLKEQNLIIVDIKERALKYDFNNLLNFFNQVKTKDIVFFSRQLSVMLDASVPVVKALKILAKQTTNKYLQLIVQDLAGEVEGGAKLSQALNRYPKVFNNFFIYMVKAGETTGRLDKVLIYLADQMEKDYAIKSKIKGALVYPAFIFSVLIIMATLMMIFVVPKFSAMFLESGIELPWTTKLLIGTSNFLISYWWLVLFLIIVFVAILLVFKKNPIGKYYFDLFKIRVPVIGPIIWKTYIVRFGRSLSSLIVSGVPVTKSLEIVAEIVDNDVYKKIFLETAAEVEVGKTMSAVFIKYIKEMPLLVTHMTSVGEETGKLDKVLTKIADFYEAESENSVKTFLSLIEPIIMVIIGLAAAVLVVSVILPMYSLTDAIS